MNKKKEVKNKILVICRKIINFSQKDMSEELGTSLVTYNQKEIGKISFSKEEMIKIEKILKENGLKEITIEDIFFKNEVSIKVTVWWGKR